MLVVHDGSGGQWSGGGGTNPPPIAVARDVRCFSSSSRPFIDLHSFGAEMVAAAWSRIKGMKV